MSPITPRVVKPIKLIKWRRLIRPIKLIKWRRLIKLRRATKARRWRRSRSQTKPTKVVRKTNQPRFEPSRLGPLNKYLRRLIQQKRSTNENHEDSARIFHKSIRFALFVRVVGGCGRGAV